MRASEAVCVLSPHLLVAQAVTAALRSVGMSAETRTWESVAVRGRLTASGGGPPEVLVVIVDGVDSPELVRVVERLVQSGDLRVVVVTAAGTAVQWGGLLASDAVDVVTVTTSVTELADVVRVVAAGGSSMDVQGRTALQVSWAEDLDRRRQLRVQVDTLSPQQRRVLELLASGHRVDEVGALLGVSRGTVRSHVKALRAKLGAATQLQAVAMFHQAYVSGIVEVPGPRAASDESVGMTRR